MKVLLQQLGSKHETREEVVDSLAGVSSVAGCVFAYADFDKMRAVAFFELDPTWSQVPDEATLLNYDFPAKHGKGQRWVIGGIPDA